MQFCQNAETQVKNFLKGVFFIFLISFSGSN